MRRPRVIPVLLLTEAGVVKTCRFSAPVYVGDAINAVKIFNQKEVDEIVILDIEATRSDRRPELGRLEEICSEAFMPLAYGGGVTSVEELESLFKMGIEKVVINSSVYTDPGIIRAASEIFGSQSIVVSVDVKRDIFGRYRIFSRAGTCRVNRELNEVLDWVQAEGAGEVIVNSIDRDGTRKGFDLQLVRSAASRLDIPLVAMGGAGNVGHLKEAIDAGASAVAAGSMFVFHGVHSAVLISYLSTAEMQHLMR
jgi:cyclase